MSKISTITIFTVAILGLFTNCKNDDTNKIIDVKKEFSIQPWEGLSEEGSHFQLVVSTIEEQKCGGTTISAFTNAFSDKLVLTLENLNYPSVCGSAAVARDTFSLGKIANGTYKIQINLKDAIINNGVLYVDNERYKITMQKEDGISIGNTDVLRVPEGALWGSVNYDNGHESRANQLLDSLKTVTQTLTIPNGDYGHFTVSSSGVEVRNKSLTNTRANSKRFLVKITPNSTESLTRLLARFRSLYGANVDILTLSQTGKSY